jgi:hypothetical protein
MQVKLRFSSAKRLPASLGMLTFEKYTIEPIPEPFAGPPTSTSAYLLRFEDRFREGERGTNPIKEAALLLSLLSLVWDSDVIPQGMMIDSLLVPSETEPGAPQQPPALVSADPDLAPHLHSLSHLETSLARQFLRSCDVFSIALHSAALSPTLSFFLLCVAVECLSNKVSAGKGPRARFMDFLKDYGASSASSLPLEEFVHLLGEAYDRHRSAFTHGGMEIPRAAVVADRLGRPYVKNYVDGKEVRTPGLSWFQHLVRTALLEFLRRCPKVDGPGYDHVKDFSLEAGVISFKAKRTLQAGSVVTLDDIDLD